MKLGSIKYPPLINEQALYVGGLREITNAYMHELHPKYRRDNLQVDKLGCKCEMIVQYHFWFKGVIYDSEQMLARSPIANYDIMALNQNIDVKGIWSYQTELRVNYDAHNKDKNITHYMFVQPVSDDLGNDKANYWYFPKQEIDKWQIKDLKFSKAYVKQI